LGKIPASIASVVLLGQAPITVILAVPVLHERVTAAQLVGGALVLAGIGVVNLRTSRAARLSRAVREVPAVS
jgi:drug/metabolite transporter (DMT)-like permease